MKLQILLLLALMLSAGMAHADITEYNWTNTGFGVVNSTFIDLDNGIVNFSVDPNSDIALEPFFLATSLRTVNNAKINKIVNKNLTFDCSVANPQLSTGASVGVNIPFASGVYCVITSEGNYSILFPSSVSGVTNTWNGTSRISDNETWDFLVTQFNNRNGSYAVDIFGNSPDYCTDLDFGVIYVGIGENPAIDGGKCDVKSPASQIYSAVNSAKLNLTLLLPSARNCYDYNDFAADYVSSVFVTFAPTLCVKTTDGHASKFYNGNTNFENFLPFITGFANVTDIPNGTFIFFDFQFREFSTSQTNLSDFKYDIQNNILYFVNNVTGLTADVDTSNENDLADVDCTLFSSGLYQSGGIVNINVPSSEKESLCFNLSSQHNGLTIYGAIKVIHNENVRSGSNPDFDFFWAVYTQGFFQFSSITFSPDPLIEGRNTTITWSTSEPLTSRIKFRVINQDGSVGALGIIYNDTLTTSHIMVLSGNFMRTPAMRFIFEGDNATNITFQSDAIDKAVIPISTFTEISGLGIFTFNEFGFPTPAGVSIDGNPFVSTSRMVNSQGTNVYGVNFPSGLATIGQHNISAIDFASNGRSFNGTINVIGYPQFTSITLRPHNSCVAYTFRSTQSGCEDALNSTQGIRQSINSTGAFCRFNPDECNQFNFSTGNCMLTAGQRTPPQSWVLYACFDNFNPVGNLINGTLPVGASLGEGGIVPAATLPLAQLLGTDIEGIKILVSLMITAIFTAFVAIKTRQEIAPALTFLSFVSAFTAIGWMPLFVWILMVIIGGFLVAKFIRQSMTPS